MDRFLDFLFSILILICHNALCRFELLWQYNGKQPSFKGESMYRTNRHFKKNDGQHNFFGESEYLEVKNGKVLQMEFSKTGKSPKNQKEIKKDHGDGS